MTDTMTTDSLLELRGNDVYDRDGDKIGSLEEIYLDRQSGEPEWAAVKTGMFGSNLSLVPVAGAQRGEDGLRVAYEKGTVKDAPNVDADEEISEQEEERLYRHYGLDYAPYEGDDVDTVDRDRDLDATATTGTTTGTVDRDVDTSDRDRDETIARDISGAETDDAMTVSEERLDVEKTRRQAGRARLRKYVVTEEKTMTVPVEREVARLEREPITDANVGAATSGPNLSEEEAEVTLSEEEVRVEKETVPVERVRLEKDVVRDEERVSAEVGREEVDVEETGDVERR